MKKNTAILSIIVAVFAVGQLVIWHHVVTFENRFVGWRDSIENQLLLVKNQAKPMKEKVEIVTYDDQLIRAIIANYLSYGKNDKLKKEISAHAKKQADSIVLLTEMLDKIRKNILDKKTTISDKQEGVGFKSFILSQFTISKAKKPGPQAMILIGRIEWSLINGNKALFIRSLGDLMRQAPEEKELIDRLAHTNYFSIREENIAFVSQVIAQEKIDA